MNIQWDEDEWELVVHHRSCTNCGGDLRKCRGGCNGSFGCGWKRREVAEIAKIKADRQRKEEDEILAHADVIRARRTTAMNVIKSMDESADDSSAGSGDGSAPQML